MWTVAGIDDVRALPFQGDFYDNGTEYPATIPSFAHNLRILGYQTCLSGNMHFIGSDQLHGFEEHLLLHDASCQ